jgi:hypothetical protein
MACLPEKSVKNDVKNRVFNRFFPSKKQSPYKKAKYRSQGSLKIRVRCPELRRIGSKPFLWWILKTREKARYRNVIEPLCISCVAESEILRAMWNFGRKPESLRFYLRLPKFRRNQISDLWIDRGLKSISGLGTSKIGVGPPPHPFADQVVPGC